MIIVLMKAFGVSFKTVLALTLERITLFPVMLTSALIHSKLERLHVKLHLLKFYLLFFAAALKLNFRILTPATCTNKLLHVNQTSPNNQNSH